MTNNEHTTELPARVVSFIQAAATGLEAKSGAYIGDAEIMSVLCTSMVALLEAKRVVVGDGEVESPMFRVRDGELIVGNELFDTLLSEYVAEMRAVVESGEQGQ